MTLTRRGFTIVELLVVMAMIAVIMGAVASSISSARERAKIQKATAEVKAVSQAILAYENWARGSGTYELPTMDRADADSGSLSFLLGKGPSAKSGGRIPVMLMAALFHHALYDLFLDRICEVHKAQRFGSVVSHVIQNPVHPDVVLAAHIDE